MRKNVLVAQSGGPSPVINASLQGIIEACTEYPNTFNKIYAAYHGVEGVLKEEMIDISLEDRNELSLLKTTPSAGAIGTCRYKLKENNIKDYERILDVFKEHDIGFFFYIGGNDSMDTADKISKLSKDRGYELHVIGIPKTIDNDVGDADFRMLDHTPGYGSCAKYWAYLAQNADEENRAIYTSECVSVYQAMGRKSGFVTAAARLGDPNRNIPMLLFFAETGFSLEQLGYRVNEMLRQAGRCIVVVNEGFDIGAIQARHDGFGHIEYGASGKTAMQAVVDYLNSQKLPVGGQATGQIPGVLQRSCSLFMSEVDMEEAYNVAVHGVKIASEGRAGVMATIQRKDALVYKAVYADMPLASVAKSERFLPEKWISKEGTDVNDEFVKYAMPLIGERDIVIPKENGLQRFARLNYNLVPRKLPKYVPQNYE